ncbi:uncharacterized protein [Ptychodera flava]|uniref:uncharacterized protein n=1 Tax=Ptychodera flava TaxID=63121 RepID=UPI00396A705F
MAESSGDQNITFADLGVTPRVATTDSYFGKRRNFSDLDCWEIIFLVSSLVGLLATIGLTIERIIRIAQIHDENYYIDITFAVLILINSVFIIYYTLDGVFRERAYELAVFIIAVSIIIIYCITNYAGTFQEGQIDAVKTARLVLVIALGPLNIVLGIKLTKQYYESRNLIFRTVGANTELQDMCSLMFFFEAY